MNKFLDIPIPTIALEETYSVGVGFIRGYSKTVIGADVVVMKHLPDGSVVVVHSKFHENNF